MKTTSRWSLFAGAFVIILLVLLAYIPAIRAGYVWDDDEYVTHNVLLTAPDGLQRIWLSLDSPSQYFPLVYSMFRLEHSIWGMDPTGYHIVNIIIHILNVLLIWMILRRLSIPGAWLAAAIWAVHPVQVESVAWVTERKNTLSTLFYLSALIGWMKFTDDSTEKKPIYYIIILVSCALALFAKTTACTLPIVMLLILYIRKQPINLKRILQVSPMILMGIAMGLVSMWWEHNHQGTQGELFAFSFIDRILIASRAIWFYLGKLVWPVPLMFSYPKWNINPHDPVQYTWLLDCIVLGIILWKYKAKARGIISALVFFGAALFPMLGFFSLYTFRYTYVADHYQYLACLGPIVLFASIIVNYLRNTSARYIVSALVLSVFVVMTWQQSRTYKNEIALWTDVMNKNPQSWIACNNLGAILQSRGEPAKGMRLIGRALEIEPESVEAHENMGAILFKSGKVDEAIVHYRKAVKYAPRYFKAHRDLSLALLRKNNLSEAMSECETALELDPKSAGAHTDYGTMLAMQRRYVEAIYHLNEALSINPNYAEAHYNLGAILAQTNSVDRAIEEFNTTLRIKPKFYQAHTNLAVAYFTIGDYKRSWQEVHTAQKHKQKLNPQFLQILSKKMPEPD